MQRLALSAFLLAGVVALAGCGSRESAEQRHRDANTPAGKVGQVAHKAAVEADRAGRAVGRELGRAAHDARAGWQEDARKDSTKK